VFDGFKIKVKFVLHDDSGFLNPPHHSTRTKGASLSMLNNVERLPAVATKLLICNVVSCVSCRLLLGLLWCSFSQLHYITIMCFSCTKISTGIREHSKFRWYV
jgi:hypothetical protein